MWLVGFAIIGLVGLVGVFGFAFLFWLGVNYIVNREKDLEPEAPLYLYNNGR